MNWTNQKLVELPTKNGFYLRGDEMSRIETFVQFKLFGYGTSMRFGVAGMAWKTLGLSYLAVYS
jgi:hypothetical protein